MVSLLNIQVHLPEKYSKTPLFILTNLNYRFLEIRAYQCYGPQRKIMVSTEPFAHFAGTLAKSFGKLLFRQSLRLRSQFSARNPYEVSSPENFRSVLGIGMVLWLWTRCLVEIAQNSIFAQQDFFKIGGRAR